MTTKIIISCTAIHISYDVVSYYSYYAYYPFSKKKCDNFIYFLFYLVMDILFEKEFINFYYTFIYYTFYYRVVFFKQQKPQYLSSVSQKNHAKILSKIFILLSFLDLLNLHSLLFEFSVFNLFFLNFSWISSKFQQLNSSSKCISDSSGFFLYQNFTIPLKINQILAHLFIITIYLSNNTYCF